MNFITIIKITIKYVKISLKNMGIKIQLVAKIEDVVEQLFG